jgi:branched-chain amino acid transport system permease protein
MDMRITIPLLRTGWIPLAMFTVVLAVLPILGVPEAWLLYIFLFFVYLAMANMWNLLCGYSGLISLCQHAFIGLGGYTTVLFTWVGLPFYLGIIAGAIVSAAFAILISIPVFRLKGIYFAIGTLVVPEALRLMFLLWRPVGGALHGGGAGYMLKGMSGVSMTHYYWFALIIGIASIFLMRRILRSELGLGLAAIRDNDNTAASVGMDVFRLKLYSFVIGAFITGLAGAIFYIYQGYIEPSSAFSIQWTMTLILATVIGGISTEEGPIIGTVIVVILHFLLARYTGISMLIQGGILVGIMLLAPQGIIGTLRQNRAYQSLFSLASI